jgi:hypothetical protein
MLISEQYHTPRIFWNHLLSIVLIMSRLAIRIVELRRPSMGTVAKIAVETSS